MSSPQPGFQDVIDEWDKNKPAYSLLHYYDTQDKKQTYKGTFCYSYEVTLNGWRYIVQAHVHVQNGVADYAGNTYIFGFKGMDIATPQWVVSQSPGYNSKIHGSEWDSDSNYRQKLYAGNYRQPFKVT